MCRLGSENTRPTGNRQEHAPNAVCPQANMAGKGLRLAEATGPVWCSEKSLQTGSVAGGAGTAAATVTAKEGCNKGLDSELHLAQWCFLSPRLQQQLS